MAATNTETIKGKTLTGGSFVQGYVTCSGGQAYVKSGLSAIKSVQLTQKRGLKANVTPPDFDFYEEPGPGAGMTVYIYSNNQEGGDDVVYYHISGLL